MGIGTKIRQIRQTVLTGRNAVHLGLAVLSVLMLSALYPPVEWAGLGYVALVPWLIVVIRTTTRAQVALSYLAGLGFFSLNVWWIAPITMPGYVSMVIYFALYFPLAGFLIQQLNRRWSLPLVWSVPMAWVSLEFVRSLTVLGFPWFFLGHSQARFLSMIQVADLGGVYLVSFVLAMVNGAIVDAAYGGGPRRVRRALTATITAGAVVLATFGYGQFRLNQSTQRPGPTISVVQDDFPMSVDSQGPSVLAVFNGFRNISEQVHPARPDLIVWPETCIGAPINPEFLTAAARTDEDRIEQQYGQLFATGISEHARQAGSFLIVGAISRQINPLGHYPACDKFNSALVFDRQGRYVDRYDKIRLVLFGEIVPFRYTVPKLYWFLNEHMTPYGKGGYEYSLTPGRQHKRFSLPTERSEFRYAVAICYEDTMSDLITRFVDPVGGKKQIDFLINISNDGWFNHSCELPQHFYMCVFRAVENRIAVARAVNTGISGFVNPDGSITGMVTDGSRIYGPGIRGALTRTVQIDDRVTLYSRLGNLPVGMLTGVVILLGAAVPGWVRFQTRFRKT